MYACMQCQAQNPATRCPQFSFESRSQGVPAAETIMAVTLGVSMTKSHQTVLRDGWLRGWRLHSSLARSRSIGFRGVGGF